MFKYYFTYWDDLPADIGFDLFGKIHMTWLLGIILVIIIGSAVFLKCGNDRQNRILKTLAVIMLIMEAYKDSVLIVTGNMSVQYLPLHLCGIAIFIEVLFAFFPCAFLGELSCVVCLPGAAAALLFPDWSRYPIINFMNLHGFILHTILVLFPILIMLSGKYMPKIRRIYMPIVFFAAAAPIIYHINVWQETNFMFLNWPSLDSPFEMIYKTYGYKGYLAAFGGTVFIVILIMYGIAGIINGIKRRLSESCTLL